MDQDFYFSTVRFGGFDKKEVLERLYDLVKDYDEQSEELKQEKSGEEIAAQIPLETATPAEPVMTFAFRLVIGISFLPKKMSCRWRQDKHNCSG